MSPRDDVGTIVERSVEARSPAGSFRFRLTDDRDRLCTDDSRSARRNVSRRSVRSCCRPTNGVRVAACGLTHAASCLDGAPGPDRLRLPFRLDTRMLLVCDQPPGRVHRRLVDDDGTDRGGGLHARGRVNDVAGDDSLAALQLSAPRATTVSPVVTAARTAMSSPSSRSSSIVSRIP